MDLSQVIAESTSIEYKQSLEESKPKSWLKTVSAFANTKGGMPDGSRIQDLDLRNIPSMRRNHIISDIFLRFEYMDRRGSGINRIMKDYSDCPVKPAFFSESSWFRVSMPNRNVVFQEKTSISEGESALLSEKTSIFHEKVSISDEKASILKDDSGFLEEQRFALQIRELADIRGKTRERIMVLRRLYNFEIGFTRLDIMKEFGVTERQASRLLSILFKHELIEKVKTGEYVFKRFEE